jgi:hypothetical protein
MKLIVSSIFSIASILLLFSVCAFPFSTARAQGSAFTYQGRLDSGGNPAGGIYDLQFTIYDAVTNGNAQGGPLTNAATGVTNGLFTVTLDFGAGVFTGANRWLEIAVQTNGGGGFITLAPRQQITPAPYAVYSANAGSAVTATTAGTAVSVSATNITGILAAGTLPANVVTNGAAGVNISGTFSGNGAGVTNVNLMSANVEGSISWTTNYFLPSSPVSVGKRSGLAIAAAVKGSVYLGLVTVNGVDNTLTVLTNNTHGGFAVSSTLAVGPRPVSVVAADVNRDGYQDLICANNDYLLVSNTAIYTLSVLMNNRAGGFSLASSPVVGGMPMAVVAADVNGDGWVDLISANSYGNTLSVLTNNRSGGFGLASSPSVGYSPYSMVAADVNGDGKVDLITANAGYNGVGYTLSVLTNDGSGGFALASSPYVGNTPYWVTAADVNGDGKMDLISANYIGGTLSVLTNDGSGGFVLASSPYVGGSLSPNWVAAVDVNRDGKVDLITAGGGNVTILTNDGSGGFGLLTTLPNVGSSVVAMDLNADNWKDLIVSSGSTSNLSVWVNQPIPFTATFIGNGAGLTNLSLAQFAGVVTNGQGGVTLGGTFTGNLSGNATTATTAGSFTGSLAGDVTGTQAATAVAKVSGLSAASVASGAAAANNATSVNTPGAVVKRDSVGNFAAGTITAASFSGDGSSLTGMNAANLAGTLADARLSANVALLNASQAFTGINTFADNVGIGATTPGNLLVVGNSGSPAYCDGTTWVNGSDRNSKEAFADVNPRVVLEKVSALPILKWKYKVEAAGMRHLGPMAQDFHAAFGLNGADDKHIATVDEAGVALAAIQGLNQKLEEKESTLQTQAAEIEALKQNVAELKQLVQTLVEKK